MPKNTLHCTLAQYTDYALLLSGSSFTVGNTDEGLCNSTIPATPEPLHVMATIPESPYIKVTKPVSQRNFWWAIMLLAMEAVPMLTVAHKAALPRPAVPVLPSLVVSVFPS